MSVDEKPASEKPDYSLADVSNHDSKNDLWVAIHEKVYNISKFVDEHPGGEEVLLDVAGTDSTEAFEGKLASRKLIMMGQDVGHSDEAREILDGLLVGNLKRGEGDPLPSSAARHSSSTGGDDSGSGGVPTIVMAIAALAIGVGAYYYMEFVQKAKQQ